MGMFDGLFGRGEDALKKAARENALREQERARTHAAEGDTSRLVVDKDGNPVEPKMDELPDLPEADEKTDEVVKKPVTKKAHEAPEPIKNIDQAEPQVEKQKISRFGQLAESVNGFVTRYTPDRAKGLVGRHLRGEKDQEVASESRLETVGSLAVRTAETGVMLAASVGGWKLAYEATLGLAQNHFTAKERQALGEFIKKELDAMPKGSVDMVGAELANRYSRIQSRVESSLHLAPKQKRELLEQVNDIIYKDREAKQEIERKRIDEVSTLLNALIQERVTGALLAREVVNTAATAAGLTAIRGGAYLTISAWEALNKAEIELQKSGERAASEDVFKKAFFDSTKELGMNLLLQGEGDKKTKGLRFIGAAGKVIRIGMFANMAGNGADKFMKQAGDLLEGIEKNGLFQTLGANLGNSIYGSTIGAPEKLESLASGIYKAASGVYESAAGLVASDDTADLAVDYGEDTGMGSEGSGIGNTEMDSGRLGSDSLDAGGAETATPDTDVVESGSAPNEVDLDHTRVGMGDVKAVESRYETYPDGTLRPRVSDADIERGKNWPEEGDRVNPSMPETEAAIKHLRDPEEVRQWQSPGTKNFIEAQARAEAAAVANNEAATVNTNAPDTDTDLQGGDTDAYGTETDGPEVDTDKHAQAAEAPDQLSAADKRFIEAQARAEAAAVANNEVAAADTDAASTDTDAPSADTDRHTDAAGTANQTEDFNRRFIEAQAKAEAAAVANNEVAAADTDVASTDTDAQGVDTDGAPKVPHLGDGPLGKTLAETSADTDIATTDTDVDADTDASGSETDVADAGAPDDAPKFGRLIDGELGSPLQEVAITHESTMGSLEEAVRVGLVRAGDGESQAIARQIDLMSPEKFQELMTKYGLKFNGDRTFDSTDVLHDHMRTGEYKKVIAKLLGKIVKENAAYATEHGLPQEGFSGKAIGEVSAVLTGDPVNGYHIEHFTKDGTPYVFDESQYNMEGKWDKGGSGGGGSHSGDIASSGEAADAIETEAKTPSVLDEIVPVNGRYEWNHKTVTFSDVGEPLIDGKVISDGDLGIHAFRELHDHVDSLTNDAHEAVVDKDPEALRKAIEELKGLDKETPVEGDYGSRVDISDASIASLEAQLSELENPGFDFDGRTWHWSVGEDGVFSFEQTGPGIGKVVDVVDATGESSRGILEENNSFVKDNLRLIDERIELLRAMKAAGESTDSEAYKMASEQVLAAHNRVESEGFNVVVPEDVEKEIGVSFPEGAPEVPLDGEISEITISRANGKEVELVLEHDAQGRVTDVDMGEWKNMRGTDLARADKAALDQGIDMSDNPALRRANLPDIRKYFAYSEILIAMQKGEQTGTKEYSDIAGLMGKLKEKLLKAANK